MISKRKSNPIIDIQKLDEIKKYQLGLIDFMLYETTRADELKRDKLMGEIRSVEIFLKEQFKILVNDKNRKLI